MNRRKFLGMLAMAPVVAKVAPILEAMTPVPPALTVEMIRRMAKTLREVDMLPVGSKVSYRFRYAVIFPPNFEPRYVRVGNATA